MLNRFTHGIQYPVTEEIPLSIELSPPHQGPELWAGLRLYLALEVVIPGPRNPEDMALATSNALRATSPARVNSHRPAALPPEEAAAPPDIVYLGDLDCSFMFVSKGDLYYSLILDCL